MIFNVNFKTLSSLIKSVFVGVCMNFIDIKRFIRCVYPGYDIISKEVLLI